MKTTMYRTTQRNTFLVLPEDATPPDHIKVLGQPIKTFEINRGDVRIGADTNQVMDDIERQGWAVFQTRIEITVH